MKYILVFLLFAGSLTAQESVKVYTEQNGMSVNVFADNAEVIPMTVDVTLKLQGIESTLENNRGLIVVPPQTQGFLITTTKPKPRARQMSFGMESSVYMGDLSSIPDLDYVYSLPFEEDREVQIYQGYNGSFSHAGEKALDFGLDIGDGVTAARGGTVVQVVESNNKACKQKSCLKYNNLIVIYHEDGTLAEYVHLDYNGALVEVGDVVAKGDLIGISGNTGWSSGPHLHFMVFQYTKNGKRKSLRTKFATEDESATYLKERKFYKR